MSLFMARAEVLSNERAVAVGEIAMVYLLGIVCGALASWTRLQRLSCVASSVASRSLPRVVRLTIQLVPVQVLCARVALSAALVWTFKLLVEAFSTPPPLSRGAVAVAFAVARVAILVPVASTAAVLTAVG